MKDATISLNNLLSCLKLSPEKEPFQWQERQELKDVYGVFCINVSGAVTLLQGRAL